MNKSKLQTYDKPVLMGRSVDDNHKTSYRLFRISDKHCAKIESIEKVSKYRNYGDVYSEMNIAKVLYKNGISIPKPITCDYIELDGKLQIAFIMEYVDGVSFNETSDDTIIKLGNRLASQESVKINKLGLFTNFSSPQWILTNDNKIKLIDFEKWDFNYKCQLIKSMNYLAEKPNTIFVGQQTAYAGNPMSTTILDVPKDKMIETPVFEEVQMGMSVGLGMTNMCVVTFYPRWDFLICAANQLINHLDKFKHMTGYDSHVIIRVGKGSDDPLDPGVQHKADYTEEFKGMLDDIEIINLYDKSNIYETYKKAYENKKPIILVEYPERYGK